METLNETKNDITFTNELKSGFSEYARYVISDRALPDARDGLKPVHRRIIWAMHELNLTHRSNYKKCARVVGEVTGKYHPHSGGTYESVVRLAQDWSLRYPLVDGQGNFGSIDGFPPAAMRYTEARLARIAQELLRDISEKVVGFVENFDGEEVEPTVLPITIPHLLLNGTKGIAVGMSSNIPPHQLGELIDGCIMLIDNPKVTTAELMEHIKGPDFPTGGLIVGTQGIESLYLSGKGSIRNRSRIQVETPETHKIKRALLVVTEIPYLINKSSLIQEIAELINENKIRGISNVQDLSKRKIRIEIEIESGYEDEESIKTIQAQLFRRTQLETLFHARTLAFVWGKPRTLNLKQALCIFLDFRETVIKKVAIEELEQVKKRIHILVGLVIATQNIDAVIELIRKSESRKEAHNGLKHKFALSDQQVKAVLDMTLGRLTKIEQGDIQKELAKKRQRSEELSDIVFNRVIRLELMREQLHEVKAKHNDKRKSEIIHYDEIHSITDRGLLHERKLLLSSTNHYYVRSIEFGIFNTQKRGGRGVAGVPLSKDEKVLDMVIASNKQDLLLITLNGIVHKIPAYELPEVKRRMVKGRKLSVVMPIESPVVKIVPINEDGFTSDRVLVTVTAKGMIKRTTLEKFANIRKNGIKCLNFREDDDSVADAFITDGDSFIFMASKFGKGMLFEEKNSRLTGRVASGVKGMRMSEAEDQVVSAFRIPRTEFDETTILTISENGYGKRTLLSNYRLTNRGAKGVINQAVTTKTGLVVSSLPISTSGAGVKISILNSKGILIRTDVSNIRIMGRSTQGVKIMRIKKGQKVIMISKIVEIKPEDLKQEEQKETLDEMVDPESGNITQNEL